MVLFAFQYIWQFSDLLWGHILHPYFPQKWLSKSCQIFNRNTENYTTPFLYFCQSQNETKKQKFETTSYKFSLTTFLYQKFIYFSPKYIMLNSNANHSLYCPIIPAFYNLAKIMIRYSSSSVQHDSVISGLLFVSLLI